MSGYVAWFIGVTLFIGYWGYCDLKLQAALDALRRAAVPQKDT